MATANKIEFHFRAKSDKKNSKIFQQKMLGGVFKRSLTL